MFENFKLTFTDPKCKHTDECPCLLSAEGVHPSTLGFKYTAKPGLKLGQANELFAQIAAKYELCNGQPIPFKSDEEMHYFKNSIIPDGNIRLIPAPVERVGFPTSQMKCSVHPDVVAALRRGDARYLKWRFPRYELKFSELERWVWSPEPPAGEILPLVYMILRRESRYDMALGTLRNRGIVVSAKEDLFPLKYCRTVLLQNRFTHVVNSKGRESLAHLSTSLAHMYRAMGIHEFNKIRSELSYGVFDNMFLGAAAGCNGGRRREIRVPGVKKVKVSAQGKKLEMHQHDLERILQLIQDGKDIPVYWTITPKNEYFFSWGKQFSDDDYAKWKDKVRVFVIPSSIFVHLERMVSHTRMMKERGRVIRIGHRWGKGGADTLADCLGVLNGWLKDLVEGDVKNFDMSVKAVFVNLYFSGMLIHEDPSHPDHPVKVMIVKAIIKAILARITHLFGEAWGVQRGGVPSGCYNTSHMDSWVMALYFYLFCTYQISIAPPADRIALEKQLIKIIRIIVYGDDHAYKKGVGISAAYFSGTQFASFLKEHFDVDLRDVKDGICFLSEASNGWLTSTGLTFLRHQFVENTDKRPGQCKYLPYRETREYIARAIWGREPKDRDVVDVLLSVLGHAYGTHGSNYDAWKSLKYIYQELLLEIGSDVMGAIGLAIDRLGPEDLKKYRQHGITVEDLRAGFPSWTNLRNRNFFDAVYQSNMQEDFEEVELEVLDGYAEQA